MKDAVRKVLEEVDKNADEKFVARFIEQVEVTSRSGSVHFYSKEWLRMVDKLETIGKALEPILKQPFVGVDKNVQDSNTTASLLFSRYFHFQFSNHGNLFIAHADEALSQEEFFRQDFAAGILYIESQGFVFLNASEDDLYEPYTGINPRYTNETWWVRFFGYP